MSDLIPYAAHAAPDGATDRVSYGAVVSDLRGAAERMRRLADLVTTAQEAVDDSAAGTDRLAGTAAALDVDTDTLAEHRQSAALMRAAADLMTEFAAGCGEMAALFTRASEGHQDDYGGVAEAVRAMPVEMANPGFYGNQ